MLQEMIFPFGIRVNLGTGEFEKVGRTTWVHSTLLFHKKMAQISHLTLLGARDWT